MAVIMATGASAQETKKPTKSQFTINTRAWSSNYWSTLLYNIARDAVTYLVFDNNPAIEAAIPNADLAFPIGMGKEGFASPNDIYGPYHRAFSNPLKYIGDYAIGVDASWKESTLGFYAGAYFKSQEIVFKETDDNIRGFYIQPRAGFIMGSKKRAFEAGAFYDVVTGCGGSFDNTDKGMLKGGFGLDFAFSTTDKKGNKTLLQFSMPLHNFIDSSYNKNGIDLSGMKRKVGYISLTQRFAL